MIKKISCYLFYRWKLLAKVKNLFSSLLLFAILISCETDDFQNGKSENNSSFKIGESKTSQLNFREFQNDQEAFNVFELLNGTTENTTFSRGGYYDENFRLELDTTRIFKIESAYRHSYTFRIVDDHTENQPVKNLILDYREEARGYYAYIATYHLNEQQQQELQSGAVIPDFKNYMDLNIYQPDYSTQSIDNCFDVVFSPAEPCTGELHHMPGEGCELTGSDAPKEASYLIQTVPCEGNGGGGPGGPTAPPGSWDPPSGGGGDGSGNTTTYPGSNPEDPTDDGVDGPVDEFLDGVETVPNFKILIIQIPEDCDTSKEDLMELFPNADENDLQTLEDAINDHASDFGIDNEEKLQHFLAQIGHETGGFETLNVTESTNYSTASRLAEMYSKFTMDSVAAANNSNLYYAPDYLHNSQGVANIGMCCRMCNGSVSSGDGYKYRGRGVVQLTGKCNYTEFQAWYNTEYDPDINIVNNPNEVATNDELSILSGMWYFKKKVLDKLDDDDISVYEVSRLINNPRARKESDINGYQDRSNRYDEATQIINCN